MTGRLSLLAAANVSQTAKETGLYGILSSILAFLGRLANVAFDPAGAWLFWFSLGGIVGGILYGYGRKLEDRARGKVGGPPFWYLRMQARIVRFGIKYPRFERLFADISASLESLGQTLPEVHGFPRLPAENFNRGSEELLQTREYLRRILPHLSAKHIVEAKLTANRFSRQSKKSILKTLA
ncbi:MAG: hypothetical protein GW854_07100 [Erythrobacter sp.]|nr:hypothetical protein [Erythrobacter sp.]